MNHLRLMFAIACVAFAPLAIAQTPAPAAAADTSQCGKPDPHPGRLASNQRMTSWNKGVQAWQDCMKKHIAELQAKVDAAVKTANGLVAESNAAIAEFNATVKDLQAQADAASK